MRGVTISAILVLLAFVVPPARAAKEDFAGTITFRDGTVTTYAWLAFRHEEIPAARDVSDMEHWEVTTIRLRLRAIARIDFDNSAAARKQIASVLPRYQVDVIRRATVTFRDGTVYRGIYLYCGGEWGNARERGRLTIPAIASITVGPANVAVCARCGECFTERGYGFCPFDGTKLNWPAAGTATAPGVARQQGRRREGSGPASTKESRPRVPAGTDKREEENGSALQAGLGGDAAAVPRLVAGGVCRPLPLRSDWARGGDGRPCAADCAGRPNRALD